MALALTPQRLLVLTISNPIGMGVGGKVKDVLSSVPIEEVDSIEVKRLAVGKVVTVTVREPGRKFSRRTSLLRTSRRKMSRPSSVLRLRVTLFLLRLMDMKYVDSPPTNGGQLRVSSPLPGSSTLMTSAPMSARIIEQNGPARTRVRSRTRIPASGGLAGTISSFPCPLGEAAGDGVDAVAGAPGSPPEEASPVEGAQVGEVIDVPHGLDGDVRADLETARLGSVTHEPRPAFQLHEGDVQRRPEPFRRRVQRRERHDGADPGHAGRRHAHGMVRAEGRGRCDDHAAARAPRRQDGLDHGAGSPPGALAPRAGSAGATRARHRPLGSRPIPVRALARRPREGRRIRPPRA